ncbi:DUF3192 domain-containing protein [Bowmanella sp. Y26]|uniref:DUF3192 domain-containing protein n=1 Tax=Bowmanella yangjiangensis TaxID=2811230 RepID=UPI001BDBD3BF|nr:DUF3192 domain-containing protein [Bowmanella yangjiangensis]MBT1065724.1 DUF3192 domain-containing protein [Bowmanella yangjiangensis]
MNKPIAVVLLSLSLMGLSGCIISVKPDQHGQADWQQREDMNRKTIASLAPGMSIEAVTARLGVPDFSELYHQNQEDIQVLFYRTHRNHGDGTTSKDECTPLVFKQSQLVGWGETAYLQR